MNLHVSPQRATDDLLAQSNLRLRVGEHVIDVGALRIVTRPDVPRLTSKAVAVLIELVRHVGATVTRDQLLDRVWTGRFPTPDVLTQAIKELRRAFADDNKPPQYIETIPKVGYRLIAQVLILDGPAGGVFLESPPTQSLDGTEETPAEKRIDASSARVAPTRAWTRSIMPLLLLTMAAAIAWLAFANRAQQAGAVAEPIWRVTDARALTSDPGSEYRPHLSPDGSRVAFSIFDPQSQFERLVVRSVEPSQLVRLTSSGSAIEGSPAWSPDGTRIAFERLAPNYCELFMVPSLGGSEREIGHCKDANAAYFDWTPDGRSLVSSGSLGEDETELALFRWDLDSGEKHALAYAHTSDDQDLDPHYSPDGRWIAFRRGIAPYSDLHIMSSDGGAVRQLTHLSARIRGYTWTSDSRSLVFSSDYKGPSALYAVDVDSGQLQALGVSPAQYPNAGRSGNAVVYEITRTHDALKRLSLSPDAKPQALAPSTGSDFTPMLSPSGERIAFVSDRSGQLQLWLHDVASATTTPLTQGADTAVFSPRWRADSQQLLAVRRNAQGRDLIEIDVASQRQRVLSRPEDRIMFGAYGVETDSYLFALRKHGRQTELIQVDHPGTAHEVRKVLVTAVADAQVDPATRSVYYTSSAVAGLFRRNLDDGSERLLTTSIGSSTASGWRLVDSRIWYLADVGIRTAVMHEFDPATGVDRVVTRLGMLLQDLSFSVTPARDAIIFAPVDVEDTDVGMFNLTRSPAS